MKPAKLTSPRYEAACAEVSKMNKLFLMALDEKAEALGTVRVNETVGVYSHPDVAALNEQIKTAKEHLENLLQEKRALKTKVDGLEEIDERVSYFRKQRDIARQEKKAALEELETA